MLVLRYGSTSAFPSQAQKMNEIQYKHCVKITKKLLSLPISLYFLSPVTDEIAPDYSSVISHPMDLGTVAERLDDHYYLTVKDWEKDVNLVWKNAMKYNPETELVYASASELHKRFQKMVKTIPETQDEEWVFKMRKIHDKLSLLLMAKPSITY